MDRAIRKFFRRYQTQVVYGVMVFVSVAALWYGLIPAWARVRQLFADRQTLISQIVQIQKKIAILEGLDEDALRSQLMALVSAVPADNAIPSVFSTIDGVAAESGITLESLVIQNPGSLATQSARRQTAEEQRFGANTLMFSAVAEGTLEQMRMFFERTVAVRRSLRVRYFDVALSAGNLANLRVGMDAFYVPIPTSLGEVLGSIEPLAPQEEETIRRLSAYPSYVQSLETVTEPVILPGRDPFAF